MNLRLSDVSAIIALVCLITLASCGGTATVASHGLIRAASPVSLSATVARTFSIRLAVNVGGVRGEGGAPDFVVFSAPTGGATGTFAGGLSQAVVRVGEAGIAVAPPFTAGEHSGSYLVAAVLDGASAEVDFEMTNSPGPAVTIEAAGGGGQVAVAGASFADPLACRVADRFGNPVPGATVDFAAAGSQSVVHFGVPGPQASVSDRGGIAKSPGLLAGTVSGLASLTAVLEGAVSRPVSFSLSVVAGPPKVLNILSVAAQSAQVLASFTQPLSVQVLDAYGNAVGGIEVTFTAPASGPTGTFASGPVATVESDVKGVAMAPSFVAGARAGQYAVVASAGLAAARDFEMTNAPGPLASLVPVSGGGQSSPVLAAFPAPLVVRAEDAQGNPIAGVGLEFSLPAGGGPGADFGTAGGVVGAATGPDGTAVSPVFKANAVSGAFSATASSAAVLTSFGLTNEPGPIDQLEVIGGSGQQAAGGSRFPAALRARAVDSYGNGIGGLQVSFEIPGGAAAASFLGGAGEAVTATSGEGIATAPPLVAGGQVGSYLVEAKVSGQTETATFALGNMVPTGTGISENDASRFLEQSGFGPTAAEVAHLDAVGYDKYLDEQFAEPAFQFPQVSTFDMAPIQNAFLVDAVSGPDQLRARLVLALSGMFVVSPITAQPPPEAMTSFLGLLEKDEFGNFFDLLRDVSLSPAMGDYLTTAGNAKADPVSGIRPNENYGRELMQLFTIGLVRLRQDGSVISDANGVPVPTYGQADVQGNSAVLTGWAYAPAPLDLFKVLWSSPMIPAESAHDEAPKTIVDGVSVPANGTVEGDLDILLRTLFNDTNTAPFICRELIQALVESNPSPGYMARVASVFDDDGTGVRGDLRAVVRAILLDPEARNGAGTSGHLMSPTLYVATLLHELGASTDGVAPVAASKAMGEDPFRPPSVFGFYSPLYSVSVGSSRVLAPEFQLETFSAEVQRQGFVHELLNGQLGPGTTVDLSSFEAAGGQSSDALLDELGRAFMGGSMSPTVRAAVAPLTAVGASLSVLDAVRGAIEVVVTSPVFLVEQ